jgi:hypothetical protein
MTCDDVLLNQDETDVDCGGIVCPACIDGQACLVDEDCTSTVCTEGVCADAGLRRPQAQRRRDGRRLRRPRLRALRRQPGLPGRHRL